jgi:glutaconate CoA-transferase subunit B
MDRGAAFALDIEELFDLAAAGRMGRMFLSGLQIDKWGNCNVTSLGKNRLAMKLPGGGGGCNLSCDVEHITLWTTATAHRLTPRDKGGSAWWRVATSSPISVTAAPMEATGGRSDTVGKARNGL